MKKGMFLLGLLALGLPGIAQDRLSLEECYRLGEANYPLTRQRALIQKTRDYTVANIEKGVYPQLAVNGTATYQSDVTKISLPPVAGLNLAIPAVPKDQYKLYGEVSQTLTDFGLNKQRRAVSRTDADRQEADLTSDLYALKDRINQLFFGALLIDDQLKQNELAVEDIQAGLRKVEAAVKNGTDFNSSANKLRAELLNTQQHSVELSASREAYTDILGLFINKAIDSSVLLVRPAEPVMATDEGAAGPRLSDSIRRPELRAFDLQRQSYAEQLKLNRLSLYPSVSAFFQGGIGKPNPVNFLSSSLSGYYLTGLRLSWTIGNSYTYRKEKLISKDNQEMVQNQRDVFLFNTKLTLRQENADIRKYRQLIKSDDEIVQLRESVVRSSAAQLENGVINANDYLQDTNGAAQARQLRVVHAMQLLLAQYNYKTTSGN